MATGARFFLMMPKIELHAHLNGSLSQRHLTVLRDLYGGHEVKEFLTTPRTMDEVFELFPAIHALLNCPEAVATATRFVVEEFSSDGVVYAELRTTPKQMPGMSMEQYVDAVLKGIEDAEGLRIIVRVLLSIDRARSLDDANAIVDLAIAKKQMGAPVVGVDLCGNPKFDARPFLPMLSRARAAGLFVTCAQYLDEVDMMLNFKPDRIGHGTFLSSMGDAVWWKVLESGAALEICPTSNVMSGTARTIADSHLKFWLNKKTDDSGLLNIRLSSELREVAAAHNFGRRFMTHLMRAALDCAFLTPDDPIYQNVLSILYAFAIHQLP